MPLFGFMGDVYLEMARNCIVISPIDLVSISCCAASVRCFIPISSRAILYHGVSSRGNYLPFAKPYSVVPMKRGHKDEGRVAPKG